MKKIINITTLGLFFLFQNVSAQWNVHNNGITTATPVTIGSNNVYTNELLHIEPNSTSNYSLYVKNSSTTAYGPALGITGNSDIDIFANSIKISPNGSTYSPYLLVSRNSGIMLECTGYPSGDRKIIFSAPNGFYFSQGNIGISHAPHSDYKLFVNGSIYCATELKVGDVAASTINADTLKTRDVFVDRNEMADYVFDLNYNLPKLEELEEYVKENHHLPGIPSAIEMKENGLSVAEMDNLLLQKIEELTLYLIEMKKENDNLKQRLEELEQ
ncbi:MAG: hypothetical protein KBT32_07935 [Bacteroidales bacterium]|nr:hypothetical protein [Candidatus Physcocola equi]